MFYGFEERFYEDAKLAELSNAAARVKWKRMKAGVAGSREAKLRLYICALPLLSLLLPMGVLRARLPFAGQIWPAGLVGIARIATEGMGGLPYLREMTGDPVLGALFGRGVFMLAAAALTVLMGVLTLLLSLISFVSLKRMSVTVSIISALGALFSAGGLVSGVLLMQSSKALNNPFFSGSMGYGAALAFVLFVFAAAVNLNLSRKGVEPVFKEGDLERSEIFARLKNGEISLAGLPYPVVETEATRETEARIQKDLSEKAGKEAAV